MAGRQQELWRFEPAGKKNSEWDGLEDRYLTPIFLKINPTQNGDLEHIYLKVIAFRDLRCNI